MRGFFHVTALAASASAANFLYNGLAITPQMGWDNWNAYGCDVDAALLISTATQMSAIGLKDVGYEYVIQDDCWSDGRFENKTLRPDAARYPDGMRAVADAIHAVGMKFGIYSDAGEYTCGQYAGSLGYEEIDAATWANWTVDYLKYDNCYNDGNSGTPALSYTRYRTMSRALNATGRPILYSMCNWGEDGPWNWAQTIANSWRMSGDLTNSFDRPDVRCPCTGDEGYDCLLPGYHCSVMNIVNKVAPFANKGQQGATNDMDMLEVGNTGMNDDEYKVHFTMWAALKSPLIIGTDVLSLDAPSYTIYTNPAILALSQDPDSTPATRQWRYYVADTDQYGQGEISLWVGFLSSSNAVVIFLNAGNDARTMNTTLDAVFADDGGAAAPEAALAYDLFDLWGNRMDNATADAILAANSTVGVAGLEDYILNVTETSYAEALAANSTVVLGKNVGTVAPHATITAEVARHGVVAYRLRPRASVVAREL